MRLVFIIDSRKNIGGGEYAQFKFAMEMAKRGHKILIFSGSKNFLSEDLIKQKNLIIKYRKTVPLIKKRMGLGKIDKVWSNTYYETYAKNQIKKFRPDWIIGYLRESAIKAIKIGKSLNIKVANFIYETPPWMKEQLGKDWDLQLKHEEFSKSWQNTKKAYEQSDILIPNSGLAGKKCFQWIPKAKVSVPVYPGVEAPVPKNVKRDIDIIYIGRLDKLKNVSDILKASEGKNSRICIIGKGDEENNLKILASLNNLKVDFKGAVTDKEKWKLLNRSKLLVFPTSFEGFGMPPLEAMAMGCNVLCSDIPIFKEIYGREISYFKLNDIKDLRRKIEHVIKLKPETTKLTQKYTWSNAAKKIEGILK